MCIPIDRYDLDEHNFHFFNFTQKNCFDYFAMLTSHLGCHILCNGFDLRLLFIEVPGRLCLPEKILVSPFGLGRNESHLVYTNTKDSCKSQDGHSLLMNP